MNLLHWNIHMWLTEDNKNNYDLVKNLIKKTNPDLITLTEVEEIYNNYLVGKLAKELNYKYVFSPCFDFMYENIRYSFGNAILSKFAFSKVEQKFITPVNFLYDGNEPSEPRTLTLVELEGLNNFKIGITHLPREKTAYRDIALMNLKEFISLDQKFVLAGDFNTTRSTLLKYFDMFKIYPEEEILTYPCSNPKEGIDHIIYNDISVISCNIIEDYSSDHFPLFLDILI